MERKRWYKDKVFYQIWPRSFKDGDGDGMGDLWGVYEKLDYIKSLGCDGIWFSPIYPSPGADCGYDISNYRDIAPEFGGMEAFKKVLEGAHARDMKVVMDLVVNHTSDEHEWFQKSRQRIDPYTDYYIWRPGKPGGKLPNNWDSFFEGKAWTFDEVRGEYYLHLFAVKQPDLNMDNPKVREEVKGILRFWLDMGVDGFREDVITYISKKEGLPDDHLMPTCKGMPHYNHGPHIHEYLNEFKHDVLDHYDCFTLAEAPMVTPKRALTYIDEKDGQLDMMIQFQCVAADCLFTDYLPMKFSLRRMKKAFSSWQERLHGRGWNSLYIENHDHPRIVSRYGSEEFWAQSAKCLAAMYLFQQGTPFIYQGQEIGMTNFDFTRLRQLSDVESLNVDRVLARLHVPQRLRWRIISPTSRDNARTPFQWEGGDGAGFTTGRPWLGINHNCKDVNLAAQAEDPNSLFHWYQDLIALRRDTKVLRRGAFTPLESTKQVFAYRRELPGNDPLTIVLNFSDKNATTACRGTVLRDNYGKESFDGTLQPWEAVILA